MPDAPELIQTKQPIREQIRLKLHQLKNFVLPNKNQAATPLIPQEASIQQMTPDEPALPIPQPEQAKKPTQLGTLFRESLSALPDQDLPPKMESGGALAILGTNEMMTDELVTHVRSAPTPPDGYVFGAGFGNILSTTLLFPEGTQPKAICTVDVIPDVVVSGRILTNMLAESKNYAQFKAGLVNNEIIARQFDDVISREPNPAIQERLRNVSLEEIQKGFKRDHEYGNYVSSRTAIVPTDGSRVNVLAVIEKQFDMLHGLASEGNIGVGYADMTSPAVLEKIGAMPDFSSGSNVIYMSNVIDHLTHRGTDMSQLNSFDVLKQLGEGRNWFIDTTQNSLDYKIRAANQVPSYKPSDVMYRPRI